MSAIIQLHGSAEAVIERRNEMKKVLNILSVLIMLLSILTVSGCSIKSKETGSKQGQTSSSTSESQPTPTPQDKQYRVTVIPPAGWNKEESSYAIAQYVKDGASFIITSSLVSPEAAAPQSYMDMYKESSEDAVTTFEDLTNVIIDGRDGWKLVFNDASPSITVKFNIYCVYMEGRTYTFTCGAESSRFGQFTNDFEAFMNSVKFQ
jgi:hypothetical protein